MSVELPIPTIHLDQLAADAPAEARAREEAELRRGFRQFGLVYVKGHSVDGNALRGFYDAFRAFVARTPSEKEPLGRRDLWFQRGWTPPNTEVAVAGSGQPDFKECYFAAPYEAEPELALRYPELYPPNVWPTPAVPGFEEGFLRLGRALHEAGLTLLEGCARALDLPSATFTQRIRNGAHVTRVLNYLPLKPDQVNTDIVWGEEHTDFNLLTLLPGGLFFDPSGQVAKKPDDKSGLFLRTREDHAQPKGTMVRGTAPEGCITVQVGQQLEILTAGEFLATPHVITAPGVAGWSRLSSAHFMHMSADEVLYPLPRFLTPAARREYGPPILAGTYATKTLVDIGLAPASAIERFGYRHYDRLEALRT
jgi:isopenicillin N synthase-like dioxygenase